MYAQLKSFQMYTALMLKANHLFPKTIFKTYLCLNVICINLLCEKHTLNQTNKWWIAIEISISFNYLISLSHQKYQCHLLKFNLTFSTITNFHNFWFQSRVNNAFEGQWRNWRHSWCATIKVNISLKGMKGSSNLARFVILGYCRLIEIIIFSQNALIIKAKICLTYILVMHTQRNPFW